MLTALDDATNRARGFIAGTDDYISKLFERAELLARVRRLLQRTSGAILPAESPPAAPRSGRMSSSSYTDLAGTEVIDRAAVLDRFEGDLELLHEVATLFLEDCPRRLDAVREALAHRDCAALEGAAHSIKGSVGNFAAAAAFAVALRLERMGRDGDLRHAPEACAELEREIARLTPVLTDLGAAALGDGYVHSEP
jgi:HPt (histidine-containing phosphotransfer) domain-containing protein